MSNGLEMFAQGVISQNVLLFQGLGVYLLLRYSKDLVEAGKIAISLLVTMVTATVVLWGIAELIPVKFGMNLPILFAIAFGSGLLWHKLLKPYWDERYSHQLLPVFLNSVMVGILLNGFQEHVTNASMVGYGFAYSLGCGLALLVMAGIRERLELADVPKPFQGVPILLISAGLLGLGLMGFRF